MRRCGECGSSEIKLEDIKGIAVPWKDYTSVFISQSHKFHRCQNCGNFIYKVGDAEILDGLIEASIRDQTKQFINLVLGREKCEQKELALHIGVTPEYLSNLKQGRIPGFQTYNFLKTLAMSGHKTFEVSRPDYNVVKQEAG